jgi:lysophospholipase L1-like esterase
MKFIIIFLFSLYLIQYSTQACNAAYEQCGGEGFTGETCCVDGFICKEINQWYSQCVESEGGESSGKVPNTIFIAGDSTADSNGANNGKTNGWGKYLGDYMTSTVSNRAISGQSARTFWRDGNWENLIKDVNKGDYVFIQFGHNDVGGPHKNPKGAAGGEGDETVTVTVDGVEEVVHTFPWYIRQMAGQVIEKGATPLLLSLTPNFSFVDGKVEEPSRFAGYMKLVSDELKIPFIDLYHYIARNWEILGEQYLIDNEWLPTDKKHTAPAAADFNAKMVVTGIKCQKIPDLLPALNDKGKAVDFSCLVE